MEQLANQDVAHAQELDGSSAFTARATGAMRGILMTMYGDGCHLVPKYSATVLGPDNNKDWWKLFKHLYDDQRAPADRKDYDRHPSNAIVMEHCLHHTLFNDGKFCLVPIDAFARGDQETMTQMLDHNSSVSRDYIWAARCFTSHNNIQANVEIDVAIDHRVASAINTAFSVQNQNVNVQVINGVGVITIEGDVRNRVRQRMTLFIGNQLQNYPLSADARTLHLIAADLSTWWALSVPPPRLLGNSLKHLRVDNEEFPWPTPLDHVENVLIESTNLGRLPLVRNRVAKEMNWMYMRSRRQNPSSQQTMDYDTIAQMLQNQPPPQIIVKVSIITRGSIANLGQYRRTDTSTHGSSFALLHLRSLRCLGHPVARHLHNGPVCGSDSSSNESQDLEGFDVDDTCSNEEEAFE